MDSRLCRNLNFQPRAERATLRRAEDEHEHEKEKRAREPLPGRAWCCLMLRLSAAYGTTIVDSVTALSPVALRAATETMTDWPLGKPVIVARRSVKSPTSTRGRPRASP